VKPAFTLPQRKVEEWVAGAGEAAEQPKVKPARLTIDLDPDLHLKFKSACVTRRTTMVDEVRAFIEKWVGG
jgi:ParG